MVLFYNSERAEKFGDLSINVFPSGANYKIKYPIKFREKLSALNAQIMGVTTIASIISVVMFIMFMIGDYFIEVEYEKHENIAKRYIIKSSLVVFFLLIGFGFLLWFFWLACLKFSYLFLIFLLVFVPSVFYGIYGYHFKKGKLETESDGFQASLPEIDFETMERDVKIGLVNIFEILGEKLKGQLLSRGERDQIEEE